MNECFHAKCGERAREAPVCPACKHNNTDVSIHQVDPGKARRDLEKCLSRRHVDRIPLPNSLSPSLSLSLSLFLSIPFFFLFNPPPSRWISNAISILPPSLRFAALPPLCANNERIECMWVLTSTFQRVLLQIPGGNESSEHEGYVGPVGGKKCLVVGVRDGIGPDIGYDRLSRQRRGLVSLRGRGQIAAKRIVIAPLTDLATVENRNAAVWKETCQRRTKRKKKRETRVEIWEESGEEGVRERFNDHCGSILEISQEKTRPAEEAKPFRRSAVLLVQSSDFVPRLVSNDSVALGQQ